MSAGVLRQAVAELDSRRVCFLFIAEDDTRGYVPAGQELSKALAELLRVWLDHNLLASSGSLAPEKAAITALARSILGTPPP